MSSRKLFAAATALLFLGTGAVVAQDPISERQAAMKSVGGAMRVVAGFARGQADYDAAAALAAFTTMNEVSMTYGTLFPEGSDTGDTKAAPAIWTDRAGFDAAVAKFEADTAAAIAAAPADLDAFRPVFGAVAANCGACHEKYQIPE